MSLQNRVDPWGNLFRSAARGTFMGNRGALHDDRREIVRAFRGQRWITCVLEFRGRRRAIMAPNRYTELFFLDEAVAFAAGHRPCAECRRERFNAFKRAWIGRAGTASSRPVYVSEIDAELHRARLDMQRRKRTHEAPLHSLPNGCFVEIEQAAYLVWNEALFLWTPEGYARKEHRPGRLAVTVLTPQPILHCFRAGYEPETHCSLQILRW